MDEANNTQGNVTYSVPFVPVQMDRSFIKLILLSLVTCGIYGIVFMTKMTNDLNLIATKRDGKPTMHYCLMCFLLAPITCGIFSLIWTHGFSQRLGDEARARGIATDFGASTFWLWSVLGSIIVVGPYIFLYKLINTMNLVAMSYNQNGR